MPLRGLVLKLTAVWAAAATLYTFGGAGPLTTAGPRRLLLQPDQQLSPLQARLANMDPAALHLLRTGQRPEGSTARSGRVGGPTATLPADAAVLGRCRAPADGGTPLPQLRRAGGWQGGEPSRDGNVTVVTALHIDQLTLLEVHCAVWPHKIAAVVYAPVSPLGSVACPGQAAQPWGSALAGWLPGSSSSSDGNASCAHAGWSISRVRQQVRSAQLRAQKTGLCNLQVELVTEAVTPDMGAAATLLPQAALQNRALRLLDAEGSEAAQEHALLLLDGDMAAVDVWQLVNWPTRWERARREMRAGRVLVLPAFQLSPAGAAHALEAVEKSGGAPELAVMQAVISIATADAGKFPLMKLHRAGAARPLLDRGFASSQAAALPELWFEAGDMHGDADDGYPVLPAAGFAPFTFTLRRHVPWADERLRGTYYHRAWQALAVRAAGLQHVVQPNTFALQLPHAVAYSRAEAAADAFEQVKPVFRQLSEEAAAGGHAPVTAACSGAEQQQPEKQPEKQPHKAEKQQQRKHSAAAAADDKENA